MKAGDLDSPDRVVEIRRTISRKRLLREFYIRSYEGFKECLARCPSKGVILELGSGGGFIKEFAPDVITSDILPYEGVDRVVDATSMPFEDSSLRAIFLLNVFHHIPDVAVFLSEAQRCLVPGGRIFMVDHNLGWFSALILKFGHSEPFVPRTAEWSFQTSGPLSGANTALSWIVFERDRAKFSQLFPRLKLEKYQPHSPLHYWISGGLKSWSLIPSWGWTVKLALWADSLLFKILGKGVASFVDIEIVKTGSGQF